LIAAADSAEYALQRKRVREDRTWDISEIRHTHTRVNYDTHTSVEPTSLRFAHALLGDAELPLCVCVCV